jgi:hypothetical protein
MILCVVLLGQRLVKGESKSPATTCGQQNETASFNSVIVNIQG